MIIIVGNQTGALIKYWPLKKLAPIEKRALKLPYQNTNKKIKKEKV